MIGENVMLHVPVELWRENKTGMFVYRMPDGRYKTKDGWYVVANYREIYSHMHHTQKISEFESEFSKVNGFPHHQTPSPSIDSFGHPTPPNCGNGCGCDTLCGDYRR